MVQSFIHVRTHSCVCVCVCEAVVIIMNVCVGGEEQPESHLEDVHGSSADVLQQRPGEASKGSTLKKTFLFETSASVFGVVTWNLPSISAGGLSRL